jgi:serine/threonine protein kinase
VNILVDLNDNKPIARVTDFGLMTMADLGTDTLSNSFLFSAGTTRWMSPELLHPEHFNSDGRLTRESDCYALGMVIYEVKTLSLTCD